MTLRLRSLLLPHLSDVRSSINPLQNYLSVPDIPITFRRILPSDSLLPVDPESLSPLPLVFWNMHIHSCLCLIIQHANSPQQLASHLLGYLFLQIELLLLPFWRARSSHFSGVTLCEPISPEIVIHSPSFDPPTPPDRDITARN
jgi:hypothetical protein